MNLRLGQLRAFAGLLRNRLGFELEDEKLESLAEVLSQRLRQRTDCTVDDYLELLERDGSAELRVLAEQLTVPETFFFRYWDHFRALSEEVLPALLHAQRVARRLRILSAGCASGEEPYSLAMLLRERLPSDDWQIEILAVDVNAAMLARAARAHYSAWSLRATPAAYAERFFRAGSNGFTLDRAIVKSVTLVEGNLVDAHASFWQKPGFDLVFCRNVLMYFATERASEVVARIRRALHPHGYLFLGDAETLRGLSSEFRLCHTHDTFYYAARDSDQRRAHAHAHPAPPQFDAPSADASWVDVIRTASERIAALSDRTRTPESVIAPLPISAEQAPREELAQAVELMGKERFADALALLHTLPDSLRRDPEALLLRAVVLTNSGRLAEAERTCRELLDVDPLNAGAHYLIALCREHAGDDASALQHDQTAAHLERSFAMPHVHMGLLAQRAGKLRDARSALDRALELLVREDASRILLFGGGFRREALIALCRAKLGHAEARA